MLLRLYPSKTTFRPATPRAQLVARLGLSKDTIATATPHADDNAVTTICKQATAFAHDYTRCNADNRTALLALDQALTNATSFDILCDACAALGAAARSTHIATAKDQLQAYCETCWALTARSDA